MQVGLHLTAFDWPGGTAAIAPTLAETARIADEGGLSSLTLMDHYLQLGGMGLGEAEDPMLEGYTTLGFLAAHTRRARLHLLVTGTTYRHPGLLAKIVSTLDVLSGGRATLGLGAGWYEREHRALGVPFPAVAERFERLEETLQIVLQMWSEDNGPFAGKHYELAETISSPQPLCRPHPPILIGGGGEKKTLRLVARYADQWNLPTPPGSGLQTLRSKQQVLLEHCEREGRDPGEIAVTTMYVGPPPRDTASTAAFLREMEGYAALGVDEVHVIPFSHDPRQVAGWLAEHVVAPLAAL